MLQKQQNLGERENERIRGNRGLCINNGALVGCGEQM